RLRKPCCFIGSGFTSAPRKLRPAIEILAALKARLTITFKNAERQRSDRATAFSHLNVLLSCEERSRNAPWKVSGNILRITIPPPAKARREGTRPAAPRYCVRPS